MKMRILLIALPRYKNIPVTREERCQAVTESRLDTPATLLIIASLLRDKNHKIEFIDANAFNLSYKDISELIINKKIDCVLFPFNSQIIDHDLEICNIVKKINPFCITIGYSWYSRYYAKEILKEYKNLDILIIGPSLSVIGNLIESLSSDRNLANVGGIAWKDENNITKINNKLDSEIKLDDLPLPAYDLLPSFKPYYMFNPFISPYALVYCGKGCPFGCRYCIVAKTKYSSRSSDKIIKELKTLKQMGDIKYVWFFDEIFTINRKRVIEICERLLEEDINIKWFCDSRVELVDEELLKIMRKAGCIGISYGVESGSQKILDSMNKLNTVEQAKNGLIWTRKAHIPINLNLILGYIGEDEETLKETEQFVKTTLPEILQITIAGAYPGTEFTKLAFQNKWIDGSINWKQRLTTRVEFNENYKPFNLDLTNERIKLRKILYYSPKWWINGVNTLVRNRELILPILKSIFSKDKGIW
jgi:radical SAM superfamily enzyme YgiQ (UPF0313 family)